MHPITLITLICAGLVLALLGLAVYAPRAAERARTHGYDLGYSDARLTAHARITALHQDVARLQHQTAILRAEHSQALEAMLQDCDERIASHARRTLTAEDMLTLRIANTQLRLAAETYNSFKMADQARFAQTACERMSQVIHRIDAALQAAAEPDQEAAA